MFTTHHLSHESRRPRRRAVLAGVAALSLALAACGGSDDAEPAGEPTEDDTAVTDSVADTPSDTGVGEAGDAGGETSSTGAVGGGEIIDQLDDAVGGGIDEALDSLPDGAIWGIVADQLGDDVDVDIDGANVRLTLNEGSTDDSIMDCLIAGAFAEEGQIITMIYPDGDVTCD